MASCVRTFYLGFGTLSSGTAVQTESGVFCSLNLPLKTFSMSSMLNAHTAEPGMLQNQTNSCKNSDYNGTNLGVRKNQRTTCDVRLLISHLLSCVVNTPTTVGTPLISIMSVIDCRTSKQKNESPGTEQLSRAFRKDVQCFSRTLWDPPMSFLHMRATREYTACEGEKEGKSEKGLRDARQTVLVSEPLIEHQRSFS